MPESLAEATSRITAKSTAGMVPASVAALASYGIRGTFMSKGFVTAAVLIGLGCLVAGAAEFGRPEPQAEAPAKEDPKPRAEKPSIADQFKQILKEFEGEQQKLSAAVEQAKTEAESMKSMPR